jgi:colanic acid/amylovoran biosynthesis glycosyltransferase
VGQLLTLGKTEVGATHYLHTAYLLSRYPAVSHTFFLHEIEGLSHYGVLIETASINPSDRPASMLPEEERDAIATTFYIKKQPIASILGVLLRTTVLRPGVVLRGLRRAFALEPWHLSHTLYSLFYLVEAIVLGNWMKKRGHSHLHIHFSGSVASVGMIAAIAWQFPYSLTVHGPDEFFDQKEVALAQKIHSALFVVCISDFCRAQLMRLTPPTNWNKFHVIRLGIAPSLAEEALGETRKLEGDEPLRILCTGRLVGAKGQSILLLAVEQLLRREHAIHLVFIGDGDDREILERLADEHGLRKHVTFAGSQNHDRVIETLRTSDLFVLPSFAEGVPVALMEAMAMGVPCISTFVAGIPELIRHEQDGLLVPAGSISGMTDAIERLILNGNERLRFRESARQRVLELYNLPVNLKSLAALFAAHLQETGDPVSTKGSEMIERTQK